MLTTAATPRTRPIPVTLAVALMWLALAEVLVEVVSKDLGQPPPGSRTTDLLISMLVFSPAFMLVYKIWQGRNWARLTYLVLTLLGMFVTVPALRAELANTPIRGSVSAAIVVIQIVAIFLVYTSPGKTWFGSRPAAV